MPQPLPLTLGADLSGIVEAVGTKVMAFEPGDHVFGVTALIDARTAHEMLEALRARGKIVLSIGA